MSAHPVMLALTIFAACGSLLNFGVAIYCARKPRDIPLVALNLAMFVFNAGVAAWIWAMATV